MEEAIYLQGQEVAFDSEHLVQLTHLLFLFFRMPKMVCSRLEMIQREFLWGGDNLQKKPYLVNWAIEYKEEERGIRSEMLFQSE